MRGPALTDGRHSDQRSPLGQEAMVPGALYVQDARLFQSRPPAGATAGGGQQLDPAFRSARPSTIGRDANWRMRQMAPTQVGQCLALPVLVGAHARLPMRLLLLRVPKAVADQRRERRLSEAKRRGPPLSEETLALADWTILLTDVPKAQLSLGEALVRLARTLANGTAV